MVTVNQGQPVAGAPEYCAAESGTFEGTDFVRCYLAADESKAPLYAFLALFVAEGINP